MSNSVDTRQALAVAVAAFRANGNRIVKDPTQPQQHTNKMYLWSHFVPLKTNQPQMTTEITAELLTAANQVSTCIDHAITMAMLTKGRVPVFIQSVHEVIKRPQVHVRDLGVLLWAPKLVADLDHQQNLKALSAMYELSSRFVGQLNTRIETEFNLIEKRYVRSINVWSAYGFDSQGNLLKFLTKHEDLCVSGRVRARIKSHMIDAYRNMAKVTGLNFVKAV